MKEDQLIDEDILNKQYQRKRVYCPKCNDGKVLFRLKWKSAKGYWQCSNKLCQAIIKPNLKEKGINRLVGKMRNQSARTIGVINITDKLGLSSQTRDPTMDKYQYTKDGKHIIADFNANNLQRFDSILDIIRVVPYDPVDPPIDKRQGKTR